MKKILFGLLLLQSNLVFAYQPPKEVMLEIQFDNMPAYKSIYHQALHVKKSITIDPNLKVNHIVGADSKIHKNFPVTMVLLVKSADLYNGQVSLEFNLVEYGFVHSGTLLMQPRIILKNEQEGEIKTDLFELKVSANWVDQV